VKEGRGRGGRVSKKRRQGRKGKGLGRKGGGGGRGEGGKGAGDEGVREERGLGRKG
jgi:hypothetical protein